MATRQWMSHPDHGHICVYSPRDIAWNEKNGWKRCDPLKIEDLPNYEASQAVDAEANRERDRIRAEARAELLREQEAERLAEEADALGIDVDGRWGLDRLRQEVEAAKEAA